MRAFRFSFWIAGCFVLLFGLSFAEAAEDDERILRDAGLPNECPALLTFFHSRARMELDSEQLRRLLVQLAADSEAQQTAAKSQLLGLGPLALPALRQAANDPDHPQAAARAAKCLPWLEGPSSHKLLTAAAHLLARRKPEGAAAALLAYLPYADNPEVIAAVNTALAAVAAPAGKADPALLRGLSDRQGVRRAAAGVALCRAAPPEQVPDVRKLLKDPAPTVRLRAAKALAEAKDAESIPVLIDLLAELSTGEREAVEDMLKELAGEWAPILQFARDDELSRGVRRDAWASWWRRCDGSMLLAVLRKHTLTPDHQHQLRELLRQLGSDDFKTREDASEQVLAFGRLALPLLNEATKDRDPEIARRAKMLAERIETGPDARLPIAALRLLAVRKPAGAVEALLAYLPYAEDEIREDEVRQSLIVLARRDGQLDPALRRSLADTRAKVRALAAEALIEGGGIEGRTAVRKLFREDVPSVRLRLALALARSGEREGVSVLIALLPLLSAEEHGQAEGALHQLAGDSAPEMPQGEESGDKRKCRDAWAAWWKLNAGRVDLMRLTVRHLLGYTIVCDTGKNRVCEIDLNGKERWAIDNLGTPADAVVLPGNHVLIAEIQGNRVTERDFKGNILWQKQVNQPISVQRLANGHTFIASDQGGFREVDRVGKDIYIIQNVAKGVRAAYRSLTGPIVCLTGTGECVLVDTTGKRLKSFNTNHVPTDIGTIDLSPSGRILVTQQQGNKVVEYDFEGKKILEVCAPQAATATALPNGHFLVSSYQGQRIYELDRSGKIVWEYKGAGHVYRARRR